jgi:hypothetical protein
MSRAVARRGRLVRVRNVQHAQAVAESIAAQEEANSIAHNATRLASVRAELFIPKGTETGQSFAAYRELADRLERAGRQLDGALYDAKRKVDEKQDLRIAANREKEIAERLKERALRQADDRMEARFAALPSYRRMQMRGTQ